MLRTYRYLIGFLFPILVIVIFLRSILKKEDKVRYKEKIFSSSFNSNRENKKKLIWFHSASIGEVLSILPLIREINNSNKDVNFLITTVTLSSSKLLEGKISQFNNITHRFFPLDTEKLSKNFLDTWKPDLVCFVDSEIWPNFLFKIKEYKIPLVLINARITKKTFNRWKILPRFAKEVFNNFNLCLASSEESKINLEQLKLKNIKYFGNLKFTHKNNINSLNTINLKILDNFKVWCCASTHAGEETIIAKTHIKIKKKISNTLTIIIPRHISRTSNIKKLLKKFNLNIQILNDGDTINNDSEILIINSFGILSKYYNYCDNIFIGKSFIKKLEFVAGQNPIEAAKSGCKIFHGPYVYNFHEIYNLLKKYHISYQVNDEADLAEKIIENFNYPQKINNNGIALLDKYGEEVLQQTVFELNKLLN